MSATMADHINITINVAKTPKSDADITKANAGRLKAHVTARVVPRSQSTLPFQDLHVDMSDPSPGSSQRNHTLTVTNQGLFFEASQSSRQGAQSVTPHNPT